MEEQEEKCRKEEEPFHTRIEDSLTPEDLQFFEENGYVILHNAVPKKDLEDTVNAIWNHLGINSKDRSDWYRQPATQIGFVELYHHETFWKNRQNPRIYSAFAQLWKTEKLWVSIDRASLKFPSTSTWDHKGFLHWDYNIWDTKLPFGLQGVLALEDTSDQQGGFHCVPGMHKWYKDIAKQIPAPSTAVSKYKNQSYPINVPDAAKKKFKIQSVVIPMKAGDFVIWRRDIAHGVGRNETNSPRLAQYISMFPSRFHSFEPVDIQECLEKESRWERINMWRNNMNPPGKPGDSRNIEQQKEPVELSDLGKRLLGLEDYE